MSSDVLTLSPQQLSQTLLKALRRASATTSLCKLLCRIFCMFFFLAFELFFFMLHSELIKYSFNSQLQPSVSPTIARHWKRNGSVGEDASRSPSLLTSNVSVFAESIGGLPLPECIRSGPGQVICYIK